MTISKEFNWSLIHDEKEEIWKNPSVESFYLVNRWKAQGKVDFLDLGCGLGRHTILFGKNDFKVTALDLSEEAVRRTKAWAEQECIRVNYATGDMLALPFSENSFDCVLCRNVIGHTDTEGVKQIIESIKKILRPGGECYLTLGSKLTWGWQQDWPVVDENTKLRMEDGPENEVPHFYADYKLVLDLFKDFEIIDIEHIQNFAKPFPETDERASWHYHLLIRKREV